MNQRLEEQIRRYTQAVDFMAAPLEELLPQEVRGEAGGHEERIEVTIPLTPYRRRSRPSWVYGLVAAVVVVLLAIPIWIWVNESQPDVADTTPTTPTTVTPPTIPESFGLDQYPLVFDGDTQRLSGNGFTAREEVVASLDTAGFVETRTAVPDDEGRFVMAPFDQCCADVTTLTVSQGDRTITAQIDRGIRVNLFGAERDLVTVIYGGGFEVRLFVEGQSGSFETTVTPDSDWWSLDLAGEMEISLGDEVTAVLVRDEVAFVTRAGSEQAQAEVRFYPESLAIEGEGFLPDTPLDLRINGRVLSEALTTDGGGHFYLEARDPDTAFRPGDTIEFAYLGDSRETTVPVLTFDSFDSSGQAVGTALGVDELSDVVVYVRQADGSRREEVASEVPISGGVWTVQLGPMLDGDVVEEASVMGRSSIFAFVAPLQAGPVENPENGNFYEAVTVFGGIAWDDAETAASSRSFNGVQGHLLTITSAAESDFVVANFPQATASSPSHPTYWLGGFQPQGAEEPGGGWEWVTGEPFAYQNWADPEPNDNDSPEQCLNFASEGIGGGRWNDQPCDVLASGYIVEYDTSD